MEKCRERYEREDRKYLTHTLSNHFYKMNVSESWILPNLPHGLFTSIDNWKPEKSYLSAVTQTTAHIGLRAS